MPIRFLNTVDLTVTSSILKTDANGVIVAAVAGTDYINTVTSAMVTTALGYTPVPTTRTLTINGTALDLSADRSWTITTITGNAGSATVLQTARTINGTSFNGSANITTANWGTARTITIGNTGKSVNGSANVTWTLAEIGAQAALTNPVTGTGTTNYLPKFTGATTIGNSQVFDNGTNVGIGTATPVAKLHIEGGGGGGGTAWFRGTAIASHFNYATDEHTYIRGGKSTSSVYIADNNTGNVFIANGGGNVGIGTTAPAYKLHVNTSGSAENVIGVTNGTQTLTLGVNNSSGGSFLFENSASALRFGTSGSERVRITSDGNVGIGTTSPALTASGRTVLSINGSVSSLIEFKTGDAFRGYIFRGDSFMEFYDINALYFSTNGAVRSVITSAGNVGIGTTAPVTSLHVVGTSYVNGDLRIGSSFNATNQTSILKDQGAAGLGIFTWGDTAPVVIGGGHVIIRSEAGANRNLYVTGNVGIGTTSPAQKVQIGDGTATGSQYFRIFNSASDIYVGQSGGTIFGFSANSAGFVLSDNTSFPFGIGTTSAQPFVIGTTNAERMRITSAGNVGIGTTAPVATLTIGSNEDIISTNGIALGVGQTSLEFVHATFQNGFGSKLYSVDSGGGTTSLRIATRANSTSWSDAVTIIAGASGNGNVGIGTTSPTNQLTVTTATNAVDVVRLNNTGGDSGSVQGVTHLAINHFNSGTNPSTRITAYQDGVSGWPGGMYFSTRSLNTDSAPVERMRITSAGNVGIGTSSPNASYRATITTAVGQTGALQTTGSVNINSGALAVGSITPSGTAGRIDASNDIVAFSTSDRRFKENITPIANALDKVKTLTGVEFDWKQETKDYHGYVGHDVGVIAQDVQAVLPEAVRTNHNGYLSVRYEKMIALLIEAMKEQQAQIDELKAQLRGNS